MFRVYKAHFQCLDDQDFLSKTIDRDFVPAANKFREELEKAIDRDNFSIPTSIQNMNSIIAKETREEKAKEKEKKKQERQEEKEKKKQEKQKEIEERKQKALEKKTADKNKKRKVPGARSVQQQGRNVSKRAKSSEPVSESRTAAGRASRLPTRYRQR